MPEQTQSVQPKTLDINPFNHDAQDKRIKELESQLTDLAQQLKAMTGDRNEFRAKLGDLTDELAHVTVDLENERANSAALAAKLHDQNSGRDHHFGA